MKFLCRFYSSEVKHKCVEVYAQKEFEKVMLMISQNRFYNRH
jgi:hypothetical protein